MLDTIELRAGTTLDCAGHLVQLVAPGAAISVPVPRAVVKNCRVDHYQTGIQVSPTASDVVISGNTLVGHSWASAVLIFGAGENVQVIDNPSIQAATGIQYRQTVNGLVARNHVVAGGFGIDLVGGGSTPQRNIVRDNDITIVPEYGALGDGIVLLGVSDNTVEGNTITGVAASKGIANAFGSYRNQIRRNVVSGGFEWGVVLGDGSAVVSSNVVENNAIGLYVGTTLEHLASPSYPVVPSPVARVFLNDFAGNSAPVKSDDPRELSDTDATSPTYQRGNFWNRPCGSGGAFFVPGVDSNRADVVDSFAYGVSVATADLATLPSAPGCPQVDADGDGYYSSASGGTDCDDADASVHPGIAEVCDSADNDCNGVVDNGVCAPPTFTPLAPDPTAPVARFRIGAPTAVPLAGLTVQVDVPADAQTPRVMVSPASAGARVRPGRVLIDGVQAAQTLAPGRGIVTPISVGSHSVRFVPASATVALGGETLGVHDIGAACRFTFPGTTDPSSPHGPVVIPPGGSLPPIGPCGMRPCPYGSRTYDVQARAPSLRSQPLMVLQRSSPWAPGTTLSARNSATGAVLVGPQDMIGRDKAVVGEVALPGAAPALDVTMVGRTGASFALSLIDVNTTAPAAYLTSPVQGLVTMDSQILVSGGTDDPSARAFVNGVEVPVVVHSPPGFATSVHLEPGLNSIGVVVMDQCGNRTVATTQIELVQIKCYVDADGDGYGSTETVILPDGLDGWCGHPELLMSANSEDCNDQDSSVHPGAIETLGDGIDKNCDGQETCYADYDRDGFRTADTVVSSDTDCADPTEAWAWGFSGDCNDHGASVNPGAVEVVADGLDQDCDGNDSCYRDADQDGYGSKAIVVGIGLDCDQPDEHLSSNNDDWNDENPYIEGKRSRGHHDGSRNWP
ncbi:MAG: right-handed parallel beta-helix repeat-containing protein [Deltaproteobacteria bacterium]|nr:right-handed parallel beta-helix repeat-containing protein [Deltaproteobacteria bacterium]